MDFPGLKGVLEGMAAGQFKLVARDTTEPSPLAHEVINAKPYAFLDDAPLEERRTQAVITRRGLDVKTAEELGKLDQAAIDRVIEEAWPDVSSADELHDALLVSGALTSAECGVRNAEWKGYFEELVRAGRAGVLQAGQGLWVAAERLPMLEAVFAGARCEPPRTSCDSCCSGSAPHPTPGPRGRKGSVRCSSCSTDTRYRRVRGKRTCFRPGSASTTPCGSTACVSRGKSPGGG